MKVVFIYMMCEPQLRERPMAFYELRQYPIHPGKMDEWVAYMEEVIIPFQVSQGMVITGSYRSEDDATYVWTRRFEDDAECEVLYEKVYKSDAWVNEISKSIPEMIDGSGINVLRMVATPKSVVQ